MRLNPVRLLLAIATAASLLGPRASAQDPARPLPPSFSRHIAASLARGPLQRDCVPHRLDANPGVQRQGSVLLVHGMTGCPQQFADLAPLLSARGFDVYLFLLPGHGEESSASHEGFRSMVRSRDWETYLDFARLINSVASELEGPKVLGGFSLGGGISLAALTLEPNLHDRLILFAPYVHQTLEAAREIGFPLLRRIPSMGDIRWNRSSDCRNPERAGYCAMLLDQILALENLGDWIEAHLSGGGRTRIQLVAGGNDFSASNEKAQQALESSGFEFSACAIAGAPHSFFARKDHLNASLPWLPVFDRRVPEFISTGAAWPSRAGSPRQAPLGSCVLD